MWMAYIAPKLEIETEEFQTFRRISWKVLIIQDRTITVCRGSRIQGMEVWICDIKLRWRLGLLPLLFLYSLLPMPSRMLISSARLSAWKGPAAHWASAMPSVPQGASQARRQRTKTVYLPVWGKVEKRLIPVIRPVISPAVLPAEQNNLPLNGVQMRSPALDMANIIDKAQGW